jgi:hypothetical protein
MLRQAFRALRRGADSRSAICVRRSPTTSCIAPIFPEAKTRDFADFWPPDAIVSEMTATGFTGVEVARRHVNRERDLAELLLSAMRSRERNSGSELPFPAHPSSSRALRRGSANRTDTGRSA